MRIRQAAFAVLVAALTFIAVAAPSAAGGCSNSTSPVEGTGPDARIDRCQFMPGILRVPVGTTVKWTNDDVFPHVVSGIGWGRTQSMLMTSDSFAHTFTEAGIYPYTCTLHPGMSAVVFVGDMAVPESQRSTISTTLQTVPGAPATQSPDGAWLASALIASILVGVTAFTAGRYLGR
jgi:plastocyanin